MTEDGESQLTKLDPLAEIGQKLREKRLKEGFSLEAIANKTHVRLHLLEAIEAGNKEILPEAIYIREFIKKYAEAVGFGWEEAHDLAISYPLTTNNDNISSRWKFRPSLQLRPFHLYILYILLVVFSVKNLGHLLEPSQTATQLRPTESQSVTLTRPKATPPKKVASPVSTKPVQDNKVKDDRSITVEVTVKDKSWVKIIADGKTAFEGNLPKGTRRSWTAKQQVTVSTGNAGGVLVSFNKGKAQQMGQPGQIEQVTYKVKPQT